MHGHRPAHRSLRQILTQTHSAKIKRTTAIPFFTKARPSHNHGMSILPHWGVRMAEKHPWKGGGKSEDAGILQSQTTAG